MRLLLTGHSGYIGAVAGPMLAAAGHEVVGLDTGFFAGCDFGPPDDGPSFPSIQKDIRRLAARDLEGFGAVVHLAALSNDPLGDLDPELTYDINLAATLRLAALAREAGVERFVFASSCSTYGAAGDEPLDERAEFNPVTPYAISKVRAEAEMAKLAGDRFSPVFLRNATAYGASPRLRLDLVLNNLVAHAFTSGRVYLLSDGTPWRPIVHVRDIAAAMIAALAAPREAIHAEAFNVGRNSENYRIRELAEIVAQVVPGSKIEYSPTAGPDLRTYRIDCSKIARRLPAFRPAWDARRGAEELYRAYREIGLTRDDLDGPRYKRLAHIQRLRAEGRLDGALHWTS
jgi:nucleoside-diphosphate-sugar epimerase